MYVLESLSSIGGSSLGVDRVDEPLHSFVESLLANGGARLDVPGAV